MRDSTDTLVRGALAGAAGTAVMTLMMRKAAPKMIPEEMRPDEFPPKKVVEWAEEQAGEPHALTESQEMRAAMGAHFAYGSGSGAVYGLLRDTVLDRLPAPLAGMMFGVGLWAIGFEGWMPALGVQEATHEKSPKKWPMPVMSHMIYGATTAFTYEALEKVVGKSAPPPRPAPRPRTTRTAKGRHHAEADF